jgi:hypothetical protein
VRGDQFMPQRSARTAFALLIVLTVSASRADAQGAREPVVAHGIWNAAMASMAAEEHEPAHTHNQSQPAADRQRFDAARARPRRFSQPARMKTGPRRTLGAVLGAFGGLFAGGLIGASLDRNCGCDDPGVRGFMLGAEFGAVAGGILGFLAADR